VIAPRHAAAAREHCLNLILAFDHPCHQVECAHHVDGAVLYCEDHRLLRRQAEFLRRRVIGKIVRCSLMRQPFAQVALVDPRFGGELLYRRRPSGMQDLVQTRGVTDPNQRDARRAGEIRQHLSHELMELCLVNHFSILPDQNCVDIATIPTAAHPRRARRARFFRRLHERSLRLPGGIGRSGHRDIGVRVHRP